VRREELTERMKALMTDADRQRYDNPLGQPHETHTQPGGKDYLWKLEKQQHVQFENWLNQRELFFDHQRMDKRTTNKRGIPDFIIGWEGRLICIEFKAAGRKLTPEQEEWRRRAMEKSRCKYYVFESAGDAINLFNAAPSNSPMPNPYPA
jgi:VRR-NUC domain-containing protein